MGPNSRDSSPDERHLGRRAFIVGGAAAGVTALWLPRAVRGLLGITGGPILQPINVLKAAVLSGRPTMTRWLRRREDFLRLYFEFYNLGLDGTGTKLVRIIPTQDALVVVGFPPQHVLEEAILLGPDNTPAFGELRDPPLRARLGGGSRLSFRLPTGVNQIGFTREALLDWEKLVPNVVPAASLTQPSAKPGLRAPGPKDTAIEVPWWLLLSTSEAATWEHQSEVAPAPFGRTPIWHTSLASSRSSFRAPARERKMRAVWTRDPKFGEYVCQLDRSRTLPAAELAPIVKPPKKPDFISDVDFDASLDSRNRFDLVLNTSDYRETQPAVYTPKPFDVHALVLSALGASLNAEGVWNPRHPKADLIAWLHRSAFARDNYVRVVEEGHIFPFGHLAVRVKITERMVHGTKSQPAQPAAYLFQRIFYVILEPEKRYPDPNQPQIFRQPHDGRGSPFTRIGSLTKVTPNLDPEPVEGFENIAEVPLVGGSPFAFDFIGVDHAGANHGFKSPVLFVRSTDARDTTTMSALAAAYNGYPENDRARPKVTLASRVALAQPNEPGDTTIDASTITFKAHHRGDVAGAGSDQAVTNELIKRRLPAFWPAMDVLAARITAAERTASSAPGERELTYDALYLASQWAGANATDVFVRLEPPGAGADPADVGFDSDGKGGALVTPNFTIQGLSRTHGAVADVDNAQKGVFKADDYFGAADAMLLGGVRLKDVLSANETMGQIPKLVHREESGANGLPERAIAELRWSPALNSAGPLTADGNTSLDVHARYVTDLVDPKRSTSSVVGDLKGVAFVFPESRPLFEVNINRLRFESVNGAKPDLRVDVGAVGFKNELEFVENLSSFLGPALKVAAETSGGPSIDVTTEGITSRYTLPVPAIEIGVFLLQNVTISAGLHIPFGAKPARASYAFASRENPFLLTVSALGGGGFLSFRAGLDAIEAIEGSLEFGGATKIGLAVAKGSLHALAGVYYSHTEKNGILLEGYFRMGGSLRVIGLVTVSAEFYMKLKWNPDKDKVTGSAKIEVEVDVGLFSASVTIGPIQRHFGGQGADPSFGALYGEDDWTAYCNAFAREPVS